MNSGRITGIRDGTYGPSKTIAPASTADLDTFIAAHPGGATAPAATTGGSRSGDVDPIADGIVSALFSQGGDGRWRLSAGETDTHECKTSFGLKHPSAWLRAIAALANNCGGYVFFGVHDKGATDENGADVGHCAVGMKSDEFAKMDPAEITKKVKSVFDPTPRVRTRLLSVGGASVGIIHVERHGSRPVIAIKNEGSDVREGGDQHLRKRSKMIGEPVDPVLEFAEAALGGLMVEGAGRRQILPLVTIIFTEVAGNALEERLSSACSLRDIIERGEAILGVAAEPLLDTYEVHPEHHHADEI